MLMRAVRANKTQLIGTVFKKSITHHSTMKILKKEGKNTPTLSDSSLFPTTDPQLTAISPTLLSPIPPPMNILGEHSTRYKPPQCPGRQRKAPNAKLTNVKTSVHFCWSVRITVIMFKV